MGWAKYRIIIFIVLLVGVFLFRTFYHSIKNSNNQTSQQSTPAFNRNEDHLVITKHARCRMDCRHINEEEIKEILHDGTINYDKTNLNDTRGATYALEGYSNEHQHLRVVFAPKIDAMVVVTCIDLDNEWQCDCN